MSKLLSVVVKFRKEILFLFVFAILCQLFFSFVLSPGTVASESMEPTLKVGDVCIINKLAYVNASPKRGDIIIFKSEETNEIIIKRVIGLPGETISFYDGIVYIDDGYLEEDYLPKDLKTYSMANDYFIPENCVFVMGDNRSNSKDSRFWSDPYLPIEKINGKVVSIR